MKKEQTTVDIDFAEAAVPQYARRGIVTMFMISLLYVGCDNPEDEQYEDFQALEKQLKGLFTWEG